MEFNLQLVSMKTETLISDPEQKQVGNFFRASNEALGWFQ
jgi:hypothetical protein